MIYTNLGKIESCLVNLCRTLKFSSKTSILLGYKFHRVVFINKGLSKLKQYNSYHTSIKQLRRIGVYTLIVAILQQIIPILL